MSGEGNKKDPNKKSSGSPNKTPKKRCRDCQNLQKRDKYSSEEWKADDSSCLRCQANYIKCTVCKLEKFKHNFASKRRIDTPLCKKCTADMTKNQVPLPNKDGVSDGVKKKLEFEMKYESMILDKDNRWQGCNIYDKDQDNVQQGFCVITIHSDDGKSDFKTTVDMAKVEHYDDAKIGQYHQMIQQFQASQQQLFDADPNSPALKPSNTQLKQFQQLMMHKSTRTVIKDLCKKYTFNDSSDDSETKTKDKSSTNKLLSKMNAKRNVTKYKGRWPQTIDQYWLWRKQIEEYLLTNIGIEDKSVIWHEIKHRFTSNMLGRWNTFCKDQWSIEKEQYADEVPHKSVNEIEELRVKYIQSLQTLKYLKRYFIDRLQIKPDLSYWLRKLSYFTYQRNEDPVECYNKLHRYFDEINIISEDLREVYGKVIFRRLSRFEKCDNEKRVFVIENNKSENNNDSEFNKKVKNKMAKAYEADPDINGSDLRKELERIKEDILPRLASNTNDASAQKWIVYHKEPILSQLKKPKSYSNDSKVSKHTRFKDRQSDKGKSKDKNDNSDRNRRCPNKDNCHYLQGLKTNGKCKYFHSKDELRNARKIRAKKRDKEHERDRDRNRHGKDKRHKDRYDRDYRDRGYKNDRYDRGNDRRDKRKDWGKGSKGTKDCYKGKSCKWYQKGTCNWRHYPAKIRCNGCDEYGHAMFECNDTKSGHSGKDSDRRKAYRPRERMNHDGVKGHRQLMMNRFGDRAMRSNPFIGDDVPQSYEEARLLQMDLMHQKRSVNEAITMNEQYCDIKRSGNSNNSDDRTHRDRRNRFGNDNGGW